MRARVVSLAALTTLVAVAPAQAASQLVIHGAGFGHGVGMSQYGADGLAQHGVGYAAILAHYYTGTQLGPAPPGRRVRVLVKTAAAVSLSGATKVVSGRKLTASKTYRVTPAASGGVTLRSPGGASLGTYTAPLRIAGAKAGLRVLGTSGNSAHNGRYRGQMELRPNAFGAVEAINALGLEDYVRGVVAGESPSSWPAAALQAQAVAARSYAITTGKAGAGFDEFPDTRSQVYNGMSAETPATDAAVKATAGQVVTYAGKPVVTYFFSTSGGQTENVENSFLGATPEPWLVSVDDPYDNTSPRHRWVITMSVATAEKRLGNLVHGTLQAIRVLKHGVSPRIVRAEVVGTGGNAQVTGPDLRRRLGLYDTWASFSFTNATTTPTTTPPATPPPAVTGPTGTTSGGATVQLPPP